MWLLFLFLGLFVVLTGRFNLDGERENGYYLFSGRKCWNVFSSFYLFSCPVHKIILQLCLFSLSFVKRETKVSCVLIFVVDRNGRILIDSTSVNGLWLNLYLTRLPYVSLPKIVLTRCWRPTDLRHFGCRVGDYKREWSLVTELWND